MLTALARVESIIGTPKFEYLEMKKHEAAEFNFDDGLLLKLPAK